MATLFHKEQIIAVKKKGETTMPGGDRTGPLGMGPRTGRALGYCAGFGIPGYANPALGRGYGMGFGHGRGWRNRFYATGVPGRMWFPGYPACYPQPDSASEQQVLRQQAEALKAELEVINKRLEQIEKKQPEE